MYTGKRSAYTDCTSIFLYMFESLSEPVTIRTNTTEAVSVQSNTMELKRFCD